MIHLDIKAKTIKLVEESIRGNLYNFALSEFRNTKTRVIKEKTDKLNLIKIKGASILKRKMKR